MPAGPLLITIVMTTTIITTTNPCPDGRSPKQDYCGLVSEEAVRKNFLLIYELLDEVVDHGYPQNSSSEALREFVLNEPTVLKQVRSVSARRMQAQHTAPPAPTPRPRSLHSSLRPPQPPPTHQAQLRAHLPPHQATSRLTSSHPRLP